MQFLHISNNHPVFLFQNLELFQNWKNPFSCKKRSEGYPFLTSKGSGTLHCSIIQYFWLVFPSQFHCVSLTKVSSLKGLAQAQTMTEKTQKDSSSAKHNSKSKFFSFQSQAASMPTSSVSRTNRFKDLLICKRNSNAIQY